MAVQLLGVLFRMQEEEIGLQRVLVHAAEFDQVPGFGGVGTVADAAEQLEDLVRVVIELGRPFAQDFRQHDGWSRAMVRRPPLNTSSSAPSTSHLMKSTRVPVAAVKPSSVRTSHWAVRTSPRPVRLTAEALPEPSGG